MSLNDEVRKGYLAHLEKELDRYGEYHNHKERMAWTATAAYIPGILVFSTAASQINEIGRYRPALIAVVIVFMLASLLFVEMQFNMRWIAADMVDGFRRALTALLARSADFQNEDLSPPDPEDAAYRDLWASFIDRYLTESKTGRGEAFWAGLLWALVLQWHRIDGRIRTELASYSIVVFTSALGVAALYMI